MRTRLVRGVLCGAVSVASLALTGGQAAACVGDCDGDRLVTIGELVGAVQIALTDDGIERCEAIDNNLDDLVSIDELILGVGKALDGCDAGPAGEALFSAQDNRLSVYELASERARELIPFTRETVNGQACALADGSGRFVIGDDTGQPVARPGWGIFSPDGTLLQNLPLPDRPDEKAVGDPIGCGFDAAGRLFATAIGSQGGRDGQLVVYFPPSYGESCILDQGLGTPGSIVVEEDGVYVPEATPPGRVTRFAPPFPSSAAECGVRVPEKSTFIAYTDPVASLGLARAPNGHWYVAIVTGLDAPRATIREHDADGTFLRSLIPPGTGGSPSGVAVASDGSVYYSDIGLDAELTTEPGGGSVRKIQFDAAGNPGPPEVVARGLTFPDAVSILPAREPESLMLGGSLRRTYFQPFETSLTPATVSRLIPKWRYTTSGIITAQVAVAWVDLPGEGSTQVVYAVSWDHYVYALRAEDGSRVWSYEMKAQPGASYPYSSSPTVEWLNGRQVIYVGGGMTMYCLDAATGADATTHEAIWTFDAGTGCTTCDAHTERNEILASPAVLNGVVYFASDVNDRPGGKGGAYALRADDGSLLWYFDLETQSTCRPFAEDRVHHFDGYHGAAELKLPEDFFGTRPGCDFDRTGNGCGNVWSSFAVDARRGLLYTASSNCDTDDDPDTPAPPPPMPLYDEAIFALHLDGTPAWRWRPREVDIQDFDFGGVPNLFEAEIGGAMRDVVGVGAKDGTYYLLDRDGVNEITGVVEPYWQTNVVPGGDNGGVIASAAVGNGTVFFSTAPGLSVFDPQKPAAHALHAGDGSVLWENPDVLPSFGPTVATAQIVFMGQTPGTGINLFDATDGTLLRQLPAAPPLVSGVACAPLVLDGAIFFGGGTGAENSGADGHTAAASDTAVSAYCLEGTPGCRENPCDDGNPCTYDYLREGDCTSEPAPDTLDCQADFLAGQCLDGDCYIPPVE
jgi:outer membrane protein assembly factor BamB